MKKFRKRVLIRQITQHKSVCIFVLTVAVLIYPLAAKAQLNPVGSSYFQNQYLNNPAMAQADSGLVFSAGVRKQWSKIPGSPSTQTFTANYRLNSKVTLGVNAYGDQSGLFKRKRIAGTFAYHLPLNSEIEKLSFGLSFAVLDQRINYEAVSGDMDDILVNTYNDREVYLDGDFGMSYSNDNWTIQAALPSLKNIRRERMSTIDRSTFFSSISYRFQVIGGVDDVGLEPKMAFRGLEGFKNILDVGANITYSKSRISFFGMYHSTKSATCGLGLNYMSTNINAMYTTATSMLQNYASGYFEISLCLGIKTIKN